MSKSTIQILDEMSAGLEEIMAPLNQQIQQMEAERDECELRVASLNGELDSLKSEHQALMECKATLMSHKMMLQSGRI